MAGSSAICLWCLSLKFLCNRRSVWNDRDRSTKKSWVKGSRLFIRATATKCQSQLVYIAYVNEFLNLKIFIYHNSSLKRQLRNIGFSCTYCCVLSLAACYLFWFAFQDLHSLIMYRYQLWLHLCCLYLCISTCWLLHEFTAVDDGRWKSIEPLCSAWWQLDRFLAIASTSFKDEHIGLCYMHLHLLMRELNGIDGKVCVRSLMAWWQFGSRTVDGSISPISPTLTNSAWSRWS